MKITKTLTLGFGCLALAGLAHAQQIGPNPTSSSLNASAGPFAVSSASISSLVSGFGGGTIYYPSTAGQYAVIAVSPGYTAYESSVRWFNRRLASHGFVVVGIETNSTLDQPGSRATQLRAALNYAINSASSTVRSRINTGLRGVAGHSMGGGGTLIASADDSSLKVGVPMTPWNLSSTAFRSVRVPQMIFGADGDTVAADGSHARPFYDAIPTSTSKAYARLNNATHFTPNSTDERIGRYGVAFAKRFVYGDTRYTPFLAGSEHNTYNTSLRFDTFLRAGTF